MINLVSRNTLEQLLLGIEGKKSPHPSKELTRELNEKVNVVFDEKSKNFLLETGNGFDECDSTLRKNSFYRTSSLFDDGGGMQVPAELRDPNELPRFQSILNILNLQQDGQNNSLIELKNRWTIGNQLPLFHLFWMDAYRQMQNFKLHLRSIKNPEGLNDLQEVLDKFEIQFFKALQTFGFDKQSPEYPTLYLPNPNEMNQEFESTMRCLKTIFNREKTPQPNAFEKIEKHYSSRKQRRGMGGRKIVKVNRLEEERLALAETALKAIQKSNQFFLNLFGNEHSRSLLESGEYIFISPQINEPEVDLSKEEGKKRILEELKDYLNPWNSILSKQNIKNHLFFDTVNYFELIIKEFQNLIIGGISEESVEIVKGIFYKARLRKTIKYFTQYKGLQDNKQKLEKNKKELLKKVNTGLIVNQDEKNLINNLKSYVRHNLVTLNQILIVDRAIGFAEEIFDRTITTSLFPQYKNVNFAIPQLLKKIREFQNSPVKLRRVQYPSGEEFPSQFPRDAELIHIEHVFSLLILSSENQLHEILCKPKFKKYLNAETMTSFLQKTQGNQTLANLWVLIKLGECLVDDGLIGCVNALMIISQKIKFLLEDHLTKLPRKLTIEEGQALYLHFALLYVPTLLEKIFVLEEFASYFHAYGLGIMNTHYQADLKEGYISVIYEMGELILNHCSLPEEKEDAAVAEEESVDLSSHLHQGSSFAVDMDQAAPIENPRERSESNKDRSAPSLIESESREGEIFQGNHFGEKTDQADVILTTLEKAEDLIVEAASIKIRKEPIKKTSSQVKPKKSTPQVNRDAVQMNDGGNSRSNHVVDSWLDSLVDALPRSFRYRDVITMLKKSGFVESRVNGHRIFKDPQGRIVPVPRPHHGKGNSIPRGTLASILRLSHSERKDES